MSETSGLSRREVLVRTGGVAVASALAGVSIPFVHAKGESTTNFVLVGCGGRGTGAAENAISIKGGGTKLVGMADVFENRLKDSHKYLYERFSSQMEVPEDRKFIGFDAYQKAMDCLKPGDVVILTTPPAFRWVQFKYAIEKGLNVFMEKPVAVDGPSARKMFELADLADKKGTKVAVGLMCRHCVARKELLDRINNGDMGDITLMRAYRMAGPTASAFSEPKPDGISELMYQIKRFHSFLWASGGAFSDFLIHNIDECCWMKGAWPVEAKSSGGRHYRGNYIDQNFDTYSTEYTFGDGAKLFLEGRCINGCHQEFASYAHGTKGSAIISFSGHSPAKPRMFKGQKMSKENQIWAWGKAEPDPYQLEWDDFMTAIRDNKPYNEAHRGTEASLVTAMGRMSAHTGRIITRDQMLNCQHELGAGVDKLIIDGPAPVKADSHGKYPVPQPGIVTDREYA